MRGSRRPSISAAYEPKMRNVRQHSRCSQTFRFALWQTRRFTGDGEAVSRMTVRREGQRRGRGGCAGDAGRPRASARNSPFLRNENLRALRANILCVPCASTASSAPKSFFSPPHRLSVNPLVAASAVHGRIFPCYSLILAMLLEACLRLGLVVQGLTA